MPRKLFKYRLALLAVLVLLCSFFQLQTVNAKPSVVSKPQTVFGLSAPSQTALLAAESKLGVKAGIQGTFTDFTKPFPTFEATQATQRGALLLISWEPWDSSLGTNIQSTYSLKNIITGQFDAYITSFATAAAKTTQPVFIRFAAEMNGDWQVWSTGINNNSVGDYAKAFQRVVTISKKVASNIKWIFNPIVSYQGSEPLSQLYPGDAYVDWVALDGYNWGNLKWGWQSWDDIFTLGLSEIKKVAPNKPLAITEIGCTSGSLKPTWIINSLQKAQDTGAKMVVWFEYNKETNWKTTETTASTLATKSIITKPTWATGGSLSKVKTVLGL